LTGRDNQDYLDRLHEISPGPSSPWTDPIPVSITQEPADGDVLVYRWGVDAKGQKGWQLYVPQTPWISDIWREQWLPRSRTSGSTFWLEPGSYLIVIAASKDQIEVRYPLVVHSRAMDAGRVYEIDLHRPQKSDVPPGFIHVPGGRFFYGHGRNSSEEEQRDWHEAPPLHEREIGPFLVARHETTYAEWIEFVDACGGGQCPGIDAPPAGLQSRENNLFLELGKDRAGIWQLTWRTAPEHEYRVPAGQRFEYRERTTWRTQDWLRFPVAGVTLHHVRLYTRWLREVKGIAGARLCSDLEWERAARGADDRMFPHGNTLDASEAAIDMSHERRPLAYGPDEVGSHPDSDSPFGAHDMAGNVWEMTASPDNDEVLGRGGSFYQPVMDSRVFSRWVATRDQPLPYLGFRVCASAPGQARAQDR